MSDREHGEKKVKSTKVPDPEVPERASRRRFGAEYKLRVLEEADRCAELGEVGALLRREGLYSSILSDWRRQRREGTLDGLTPRKRGRKPDPDRAQKDRIAELERELARLRTKLVHAEKIIEVQKKLSEVLGIPLDPPRSEESAS
jgi:transposase-like protein